MQAATPLVAWRGTKGDCGRFTSRGRAGPHRAGGHTLSRAANLSLGFGAFVLLNGGTIATLSHNRGTFWRGRALAMGLLCAHHARLNPALEPIETKAG